MEDYPGLPPELAREFAAVKARHESGASAPDDVAFLIELVERGMRAVTDWIRAWEACVTELRDRRRSDVDPARARGDDPDAL